VTGRVLGVDPGTAVTGYGVLDSCGSPSSHATRRPRLIECGIIRTNPRDKLWNRLAVLFEGVDELIHRHQPDTLAVEDIFYGRNVRTTVTLGHARGAVLLAGARAGLDVVEFAPASVKKAIVGNGGAAKAQVGYMVQQILRLQSPPTPADAADGVAVALTYLMTRFP
jgi:crossover junction endodeoxyribonuclease RuvC